jgi:hypothetical protein
VVKGGGGGGCFSLIGNMYPIGVVLKCTTTDLDFFNRNWQKYTLSVPNYLSFFISVPQV